MAKRNENVVATNRSHKELNADLIAMLKLHEETLSPMEMLAVASHLVGVLIALQDKREVDSGLAMEVVQRNIEAGNAEALAVLETGPTVTDEPAGSA